MLKFFHDLGDEKVKKNPPKVSRCLGLVGPLIGNVKPFKDLGSQVLGTQN
jgi:hypothetical protein